jgi:hypothetical protein
MTDKGFMDKLQESYDGEFSIPDMRELQSFITDNQINEVGIQNLYNVIRQNYTYHKLPSFGQICKYYKETASHIPTGIRGSIHPESPLQQLWRAESWQADKIVQGCRYIQKQQKVRKLASWEISFITIWEDLLSVEDDFINIAKQRIVANGNKQLSNPVNLDDISKPCIPVKISDERSNKTVSVQDAVNIF